MLFELNHSLGARTSAETSIETAKVFNGTAISVPRKAIMSMQYIQKDNVCPGNNADVREVH